MQQLLETTLTIKQLLVIMLFLGFSITPWELLYRQKQTLTPSVIGASTPSTVAVPMASNPYPTLPPMAQLNKALVLDNQAINRLKALVNQPTNSNPSLDKLNARQVMHNRIDNITQRCWLDGQSYVAGDIVKTPNGWVRCNPTQVRGKNTSDEGENLEWENLSN